MHTRVKQPLNPRSPNSESFQLRIANFGDMMMPAGGGSVTEAFLKLQVEQRVSSLLCLSPEMREAFINRDLKAVSVFGEDKNAVHAKPASSPPGAPVIDKP